MKLPRCLTAPVEVVAIHDHADRTGASLALHESRCENPIADVARSRATGRTRSLPAMNHRLIVPWVGEVSTDASTLEEDVAARLSGNLKLPLPSSSPGQICRLVLAAHAAVATGDKEELAA